MTLLHFSASDSGSHSFTGSGVQYFTFPSVTKPTLTKDYPYLLGDMTPFIGTGTVAFDIDTIRTQGFTGTGSLGGSSDSSYFSSITVTYSYAPVPLPGALVLLNGGLVRLAAYSRRRKLAASS